MRFGNARHLEKEMKMCWAGEGATNPRRKGTGRIDQGRMKGAKTHLPPAIPVNLIFLNNFYALASTKGDLIFVLWDKVVSRINVLNHKETGLGGERSRLDIAFWEEADLAGQITALGR